MTVEARDQTEVVVAVRGLRVELTDGVDIVDDISFELESGRVLALVGESGCGKTATGMAMLGFARPGTRIARGEVMVGRTDILQLSPPALRRASGSLVSYVPQDPSTSLNPSHRIGTQIAEMLEVHGWRGRARIRTRAEELLEQVQLPHHRDFQRRYPHELSGGQQQRVVIAMALACEPKFVVLDEPTTGLDVTTQARFLRMIDDLRARTQVALLYITHDLAVVAQLADRVAVMYGGRIVESALRETIFVTPRHPYTVRLIRSIPKVRERTRLVGIPGTAVAPGDRPPGCPFEPRCEFRTEICSKQMPPVERPGGGHEVRCFHAHEVAVAAPRDDSALPVTAAARAQDELLVVESLVATYRRRRSRRDSGELAAVRGVSLVIRPREGLAIVGESGSGKTTLARCLAGLHVPESGTIRFDGVPLAPRARARPTELRRRIQVVFQNPDASLNPRQSVIDIVTRPLQQFFGASRDAADEQAAELLSLVRLHAGLAGRYPAELSGGEKQRIAIARALAADPALVICDEITSALDVSVQAAIIDLLGELKARLGTALLFISHDLAVVRSIADRIIVMQEGSIREEGPAERVFLEPVDGYTQELLKAAPSVG